MSTIGAAVKAARKAAHLSQDTVATAMAEKGFAWHQATVYKIETGRRQLQADEAKALAEVLNVDLDSLFSSDQINGVDIQIGAAVSVARRRLGWSQAALAEKLGEGWHQQTILRIEKAERPMKVAELLHMAEVMRIPAGQLCGQMTITPDALALASRIAELEAILRQVGQLVGETA